LKSKGSGKNMKSKTVAGYFNNGLPYNKFGHGPRDLVIFQGLTFENKPLSASMFRFFFKIYKFLGEDYTVYVVNRKSNLPDIYTLKNMADDYAKMITEEFEYPIDLIGVSTGGSIAQHFAADHPKLVRKLVIHSSAYTLNKKARDVQMHAGQLANQRKWREACFSLMSLSLSEKGIKKYMGKLLFWFISLFSKKLFGAPEDPSDLIVTIKAEDNHNFKNRLSEIAAPTLVIAGSKDPFYSEILFCETAECIPNAKLILYRKLGHPASGRKFARDVIVFLKEA
jgi:pimeloyl-ACP methyl ester carboxylesterase